MTFDELSARLIALENAFRHHQHTGQDSKKLRSGIVNEGSLTAQNESIVDGTYGAEEAAVINNNRTRIEEIEAALISNNILT